MLRIVKLDAQKGALGDSKLYKTKAANAGKEFAQQITDMLRKDPQVSLEAVQRALACAWGGSTVEATLRSFPWIPNRYRKEKEHQDELEDSPLTSHWRLGNFVKVQTPAEGTNRATFRQGLARLQGCSNEAVDLSCIFQELWPEKADLLRVVRQGLTWKQVQLLMDRRLTSKDRKALERFVQRTRPDAAKLRQKVRSMVAGKTPADR